LFSGVAALATAERRATVSVPRAKQRSVSSPVQRWFAHLTDDLLRRGDHRSVQAVEADIRAWVRAWNDNPKPFIWTKTAEQILERLGRLMTRISDAGH
jgi:hypothetical protein